MIVVVLAASAALVLGACSAGSSSQAPASVAPATVAPAPSEAAPAPSEAAPSEASEAPPSTAAAACEVAGSDGTAAEIKGFAFPSGLSIDAGSAIGWTNADGAPHTVTFDDGSCDTRVDPGATVTVTYGVAGTYAFHCSIHPNSKGNARGQG
jgi:plastocyanin